LPETHPFAIGPTDDLSVAATRELRTSLLPATIQNALRSEFYAEHWKSSDPLNVGLDSLSSLPLINKQLIRSAGDRARIPDEFAWNEVFTSGTTGVPLVTVRGWAEQKFIREFFLNVHQQRFERPLLRGLQINNPYHGYHVSVPCPVHFHSIGVYDRGSFDHGRQTLLDLHNDKGVESECKILLGLERCLRAFTQDTLAQYPDGLQTKLEVVVSYSQYLTRKWRELLKQAWACTIVDRFSLAEIFGGAGQCPYCNWWHFDPFLVPEVISRVSSKPLSEGRGLLVLTSLYPFQQSQPMIRYTTGDLVEVTCSRACHPGLPSIRPLGRAAYGVPAPSTDEWILTPAAILEVLDVQLDVRRLPRFLDSEQVRDPFEIGHPKYQTSFRQDQRKTRITLTVEPATEDPARRGRLKNSISEGLRSGSPELTKALAEGEAMLDIVFSSDLTVDLISHAM
jgi:hypothetical protein